MKQILTLAALLLVVSALTFKPPHDATNPPYNSGRGRHDPLQNQFVLSFDWAPRQGKLQLERFKFNVQFNDAQVFRNPEIKDRSVHHQQIKVIAKVGVNKLKFTGQTQSTFGIVISNIKLQRNTFCGHEDVIVNGQFTEGLPAGKDYDQPKSIKGWTGINDLEIGKSAIYNSGFPNGSIVVELSSEGPCAIEQTFELDELYRLK